MKNPGLGIAAGVRGFLRCEMRMRIASGAVPHDDGLCITSQRYLRGALDLRYSGVSAQMCSHSRSGVSTSTT